MNHYSMPDGTDYTYLITDYNLVDDKEIVYSMDGEACKSIHPK